MRKVYKNTPAYKPSYDDELIDYGMRGLSHVDFCRDKNIGERTFYKWVRKEESFRESYDKMKAAGRSVILKEMQDNLDNNDYDKRAAEKILVARYRNQDNVYLPEIDMSKSFETKYYLSEAAAMNSEISLEQWSKITTNLQRGLEICKSAELERRIEELEKKYE